MDARDLNFVLRTSVASSLITEPFPQFLANIWTQESGFNLWVKKIASCWMLEAHLPGTGTPSADSLCIKQLRGMPIPLNTCNSLQNQTAQVQVFSRRNAINRWHQIYQHSPRPVFNFCQEKYRYMQTLSNDLHMLGPRQKIQLHFVRNSFCLTRMWLLEDNVSHSFCR